MAFQAAIKIVFTLSLISTATACSCLYEGPQFLQDLYCKAEYIIRFKVTGSELIGDTSGPFPGFQERRISITTPIVYKNSGLFTSVSDKNSLYSASNSAACGVNLAINAEYVISGYVSNGKLRISLCSPLIRKVEDFTEEQLTYLKDGYGTGCKCSFEYCATQEDCPARKPAKSCIGLQSDPSFSCHDKYARCACLRGWWWLTSCRWVSGNPKLFNGCLNGASVKK